MTGRTSDLSEALDRKTSRSICEAVAERLQRSLPPDSSRLPCRLEHLMDELHKREGVAARFE
ncbi:MAG: hypothetical protein WA418_15735 [Bradyrhizobium sp.]